MWQKINRRLAEEGSMPADSRAQLPFDLLVFAGYPRVPVHERTVGVIPPGPDVQLELCGQSVPVWASDDLEHLALEHRRSVVMRQPGGGVYDELDAHQPQTLL